MGGIFRAAPTADLPCAPPRSDVAAPDGLGRRLHAILDPELRQERRDVALHGVRADAERIGDLVVAEAPGEKTEDGDLPLAQLGLSVVRAGPRLADVVHQSLGHL